MNSDPDTKSDKLSQNTILQHLKNALSKLSLVESKLRPAYLRVIETVIGALIASAIIAFTVNYIFRVPNFEIQIRAPKNGRANTVTVYVINSKSSISFEADTVRMHLLVPEEWYSKSKVYVHTPEGVMSGSIDPFTESSPYEINGIKYRPIQFLIPLALYPRTGVSAISLEVDDTKSKFTVCAFFDTPLGRSPNLRERDIGILPIKNLKQLKCANYTPEPGVVS